MYWWSNIAVPETPDTRIIVDADGAYVADNNTSLAPIPVYNGDDVTYPINVPAAGDYFYNIPPKNRKFEAAVDADGYGLIHTSTMRLKGRKLFCWGQNPGGDRWQEYLTEDGSADRYVELQAGLAHTQYECIPMPPHTTWEWLEAYGALQADGDKVHGEWEGAKAEVRKQLHAIVTDDEMDRILADTKKMATSAATGEMILCGSGWGALENMRRKQQGQPCMASHLNFGTPGPEQADWICLLKRGFFPEHAPGEIPPSWMLQTEWVRMMEAAIEGGDRFSWYAHLQLGITYLCMNRLEEAGSLLEKSMLLCPSCWAVYGMAHVQRQMGNHAAAATLAAKAYRMRPTDVSLAKETMELLVDAKMYEDALELADGMVPAMQTVGRVQLYTAQAHIRLDHIEEAEAVLYAAGGVALPDIREGELSITELYLDIAEKKAARDGVSFNRETADASRSKDYGQYYAAFNRHYLGMLFCGPKRGNGLHGSAHLSGGPQLCRKRSPYSSSSFGWQGKEKIPYAAAKRQRKKKTFFSRNALRRGYVCRGYAAAVWNCLWYIRGKSGIYHSYLYIAGSIVRFVSRQKGHA